MSTLDALHDAAAPVVGQPRRDGGQSDAARRILAAAAPRFYLEGIRGVRADVSVNTTAALQVETAPAAWQRELREFTQGDFRARAERLGLCAGCAVLCLWVGQGRHG